MDGFDLAEYCTRALREWIANAEADSLTLRIPKGRGNVVRRDGMHVHATPELILQESGVSILRTPLETLHLRPGTLCITPRGVPHAESCRSWQGQPFRNILFAYSSDWVSFHAAGDDGAHRPVILRHGGTRSTAARRVARYLDDVEEVFWGNSPGRDAIIKGLLLGHLASLLNIVRGSHLEPSGEHPMVARCKELVAGNLSDPDLSVDLLAKWIGCSADYLSHRFRVETRVRLKQFINEKRVDHATDLLSHGNLNVSEVGWASGYSDPGYFTRMFHRITGTTPRTFRRKQERSVTRPRNLHRSDRIR